MLLMRYINVMTRDPHRNGGIPMNIRHPKHSFFHTCTAVALPLVLMIGCSEPEPVALERGAVSRITLAPESDSGIVVDSSGLRYLKVTTVTPPLEAIPQHTPVGAPATPVLYFATDKDAVAAEDADQLKQHAEFLLGHARYVLHVNGHADERGTPIHNADLSARRAQQVAKLLTSQGVPAAQVNVASFGARMPVGDPHHWDENRRVELLYADDTLLSAR
jgi:outer membrane protein OmpA-like peptidoglycan-associated protein